MAPAARLCCRWRPHRHHNRSHDGRLGANEDDVTGERCQRQQCRASAGDDRCEAGREHAEDERDVLSRNHHEVRGPCGAEVGLEIRSEIPLPSDEHPDRERRLGLRERALDVVDRASTERSERPGDRGALVSVEYAQILRETDDAVDVAAGEVGRVVAGLDLWRCLDLAADGEPVVLVWWRAVEDERDADATARGPRVEVVHVEIEATEASVRRRIRPHYAFDEVGAARVCERWRWSCAGLEVARHARHASRKHRHGDEHRQHERRRLLRPVEGGCSYDTAGEGRRKQREGRQDSPRGCGAALDRTVSYSVGLPAVIAGGQPSAPPLGWPRLVYCTSSRRCRWNERAPTAEANPGECRARARLDLDP